MLVSKAGSAKLCLVVQKGRGAHRDVARSGRIQLKGHSSSVWLLHGPAQHMKEDQVSE